MTASFASTCTELPTPAAAPERLGRRLGGNLAFADWPYSPRSAPPALGVFGQPRRPSRRQSMGRKKSRPPWTSKNPISLDPVLACVHHDGLRGRALRGSRRRFRGVRRREARWPIRCRRGQPRADSRVTGTSGRGAAKGRDKGARQGRLGGQGQRPLPQVLLVTRVVGHSDGSTRRSRIDQTLAPPRATAYVGAGADAGSSSPASPGTPTLDPGDPTRRGLSAPVSTCLPRGRQVTRRPGPSSAYAGSPPGPSPIPSARLVTAAVASAERPSPISTARPSRGVEYNPTREDN